ncbi:molybdopterin-dependent oxidoreductase [Bacillus marinisedimentorum]|uniref:molybdopterin-dependent oxidoreductase n=1 Tax=Bacillus marinisedimentorum TaxID=1821260 RepID=UPI000871D59F|nr:molybdopterin-dependent oxidoreductase [Bacillus marinisedimentorum]
MKDGIYRNSCPRNCYGTCGILSHVENNKLIKVTGNPNHGYTKGKLCAKGYAYTEFVYSPHRLKYPMMQTPRGSGNWQRISWDEAYSRIAEKMIELNRRYGSNLASGYNKFSGNLGLLHYATEGMFNSIGPHTKPVGNPCALTGKSAFNRSFHKSYSSVPEDMQGANLIVLWGANPAVTNVHQMKFIYGARRRGAKLVVIDPIFTKTAQKADLYIQIQPGTDMWLALGIAKILLQEEKYAEEFVERHSEGWAVFKHWLETELELEYVHEKTGVSLEAICELSSLYASIKPAATWAGLGIQRTCNGSNSIEAINSLVAMTGNLTEPNGGLYYMHFDVEKFPCALLHHQGPQHPVIKSSREAEISNLAENALKFNDPPLKLLWIASRNILTQDTNLNAWQELLDQLELVVTVDLFMTKTAQQSDIVLPAATHFEEEDLNIGYWHYWLSLNQKAIPPYYEAKSDLQIARELTQKLNERSPSFSNFPADKEPIDWIKDELTPEIMQRYGISCIEDLMERPFHKKGEPLFSDMKEKFHFFLSIGSELPEKDSAGSRQNRRAFRLISPQSLLKIHSQYEWLSWLHPRENKEAYVQISRSAAADLKLDENMKVEIFNEHGKVIRRVKINPLLPSHTILATQGGQHPINQLIKEDGKQREQEASSYFYDSLVNIRKWREPDV